jgi:integral membrane protein
VSTEDAIGSPQRNRTLGKGVRGALTRYRIMAFVVGTALVILVFVAIPIQVWGNDQSVAEVVAPIHGYLYIVYLVASADLARRAHWRLGRILMVVAAGFVPFLAFFVEHNINGQTQAELAAADAAPLIEDASEHP